MNDIRTGACYCSAVAFKVNLDQGFLCFNRCIEFSLRPVKSLVPRE